MGIIGLEFEELPVSQLVGTVEEEIILAGNKPAPFAERDVFPIDLVLI